MVVRCSCGKYWNVSVYANIPEEGYQCPDCETKAKKAQRKVSKPKKKNKNEGRVSSVLQRNRKKHSVSNS